ncbi:hypothetical protein CNMCM8980_004776 [Aspergillus fumigatiaffinis]|uniref:Uncharacterized protein n=1 Tax=Aspergillus fumigatiaffinis TaxID=340414 RepID=A0A8H4HCT5_9EURO|nr:hypothetical protein CNMCM5878_002418 [Aspergillus fumigatiaffinis]KAF4234328.1 hypothetical protein CNMCM6457_004001 [Aspergillus fumigatiaffinis]KAF4242425.1 hypothetical protein CNMCM6805_002938 [Aspergillus fumigatiaffinis]KAF4248929.1 hypothetical protein CNMCM8980_004776 [Aspergillus fumigatiaffinis]
MSLQPYDTLLTFHDEYRAASAQDYEGAVSGVWDLLLNYYFNQKDGFVHRTQDKVEGGYVDMSSYQWAVRPNQPRRVRTPFLVTQCKRTARENDAGTWAEGLDQLDRYMRYMVSQHPWPHPQYGIIAVGRYAEFYKWDAAVSAPALYTSRYDILGDSAAVHEHLMEIRAERLAGR